MENKKVILVTIIIILGIISAPTIYKVSKIHQEKLMKVVENEITYQANLCFNEDKCKNKTVYLKELYEQDYLKEKMSDPITKKYYSEESFINLDTKEIKLIS